MADVNQRKEKKRQDTVPEPSHGDPPKETGSAARKRWQEAIDKVISENQMKPDLEEANEGLIDELRRANKTGRSKLKKGVLKALKSPDDSDSTISVAREKLSAKEIYIRKNAHKSHFSHITGDEGPERPSVAEYERQAKQKYPITLEIRERMDNIKMKRDLARQKKIEKMTKKPGLIERLFMATIFGQVLKANPRFYSLDPLDHLPSLCRRCRRPLVDTLESRFTSVGILYCMLLPIIGIILLFANKEFFCVVCNELYVYGDLTAKPEEEFDSEDEGEPSKQPPAAN